MFIDKYEIKYNTRYFANPDSAYHYDYQLKVDIYFMYAIAIVCVFFGLLQKVPDLIVVTIFILSSLAALGLLTFAVFNVIKMMICDMSDWLSDR